MTNEGLKKGHRAEKNLKKVFRVNLETEERD